MKRWQERGVVDDSEDDTLSLQANSPSPERPRKRQKQNQNVDATEDAAQSFVQEQHQSPPPTEADEDGWAQPAVATGCGHETGIIQPLCERTAPVRQELNKFLPQKAAEYGTPKHHPDTITNDSEPMPSVLMPSQLGEEGNISYAADLNEDVATPLLVIPSSTQDRVTALSHSAVLSDMASLDDVTFLPPVTPEPELLSSPLSERDVSPPQDWAVSKRVVAAIATPVARTAPIGVQDGADSSARKNDYELHIGQRTFRNRKPIQLQPYQLERMSYLQKCRALGMKAVVEEEREKIIQSNHEETLTASSQGASSAYSTQSSQQGIATQEGRLANFDYFATAAADASDDEIVRNGRLPKRRRFATGLDDATIAGPTTYNHYDMAQSERDHHEVPASPPQTDSDTSLPDDITGQRSRTTASGFKLPRGLTPLPLPTPQISSDRKAGDFDHSNSSALSSPKSRRSIAKSRRRASAVSVSSSSANETGHAAESNSESLRFVKESKRIKGVLPASWLRIDFNAQKDKRLHSPSNRRTLAASPPPSEQPKGIARRVLSKISSGNHAATSLSLSGDDSESDASIVFQGSAQKKSYHELDSYRSAATSSFAIGSDEDMEHDAVDPMLVAASRKVGARRRRTQQPRITDSFPSTSKIRKNSLRKTSDPSHRTSVKRSRQPTKLGKSTAHFRPNGPAPERLSIVDAPLSPQRDAVLPPFIRLALRRTRHDPGDGRHSPTNKILRLTTADDTEEATSVLRAWKDGKIAQKSNKGTSIRAPVTKLQRNRGAKRFGRSPLSELSPNRKQDYTPLISKSHVMPGASANFLLGLRPLERTLPLTLESSQGGGYPTTAGNLGPHKGEKIRVDQKLVQRSRLRNAQLESLQTDFDHAHRDALFERRIQCLTEHVARPKQRFRTSELQLERYLTGPATGDITAWPDGNGDSSAAVFQSRLTRKIPYRARKRPAQKIDTEAPQFEQPYDLFPADLSDGGYQPLPTAVEGPILQGLSGNVPRHAYDFDITPLNAGSYFDPSTFIGCGELDDALHMSRRDLDHGTERLRVQLTDTVMEWSAWTEEVADDFAKIPAIVRTALQTYSLLPDPEGGALNQHGQHCIGRHNIEYLLRSVVRYGSTYLTFADPVDRVSCVHSLQRLICNLADIITEMSPSQESLEVTLICIAQYQLVLAKQAAQLCEHALMTSDVYKQTEQLLGRTAMILSRLALTGRFERIRITYSEKRTSPDHATGMQNDDTSLSSIVVLNHVLKDNRSKEVSLWQILGAAISTDISQVCAFSEFESFWHSLFTILPALEIDILGYAQPGCRLLQTQDGSAFLQAMVSRVLALYEPSSRIRGYAINDYIRTTLSRCFCLVDTWGWRQCEPLLNAIYDFFARRDFALLNQEESLGSPKYLEHINDSTWLQITPGDRSFHIFLKLLLTGLRDMHKYSVYTDRKIQGIAYRLLPNHGRSFRRDGEVKQRDLDALRNHYDLLCTLYCAMPPGFRIRIGVIQNLIDHAVSHREACRISVRAWSNITSFQVSTSEPLDLVTALSDWFYNMLSTASTQYRLAKSEAEYDYQRASKEAAEAGTTMPLSILEATVANNQLLIAQTIIDALAGLKRAISLCSSPAVAKSLVEGSRYWTVFDLFDASQTRLIGTMNEGLQVTNTLLDLENHHPTFARNTQHVASEDSQDYGDFSALEDFVQDEPTIDSQAMGLVDIVTGPLWHFMSNVFGADLPADDGLSRSLIDTWVRIIKINVRGNSKSWLSYVDEYGADSWYQIRDTAQKRKFTTYLMSRVMEESDCATEIRDNVVTYWVLSLVEREARVKFQNVLTSALLNHCPIEPLLQNLPFARNARTKEYHVTLDQFRQRRLALISSVLCNMREHYELVSKEQPSMKIETKGQYIALLRQLMQAMKQLYLEQQALQSNKVADANVQGAYVEFVQSVVSFLQQHVANICPVDPFFTDSAAFPLPATDPTYVVGKLRAYVPQLHESKSRKALATFVQAVSERAIIDGQQQYLVDQMCTAMQGTLEGGCPESPSLRHVLLTSVFPAYIESALKGTCAWVLVLPLLQASATIIQNMLYCVDMRNNCSIQATQEIMIAMLQSISSQCQYALVHPELFEIPSALKTLSALLYTSAACFTLAQYLERARPDFRQACKALRVLQEQTDAIRTRLRGIEDLDYQYILVESSNTVLWPDARAVTDKQIQESLSANWKVVGDRYFLKRGNTSKEISVQLDIVGEERDKLRQCLDHWDRAFAATFDYRERKRYAALEADDLDDIMI